MLTEKAADRFTVGRDLNDHFPLDACLASEGRIDGFAVLHDLCNVSVDFCANTLGTIMSDTDRIRAVRGDRIDFSVSKSV